MSVITVPGGSQWTKGFTNKPFISGKKLRDSNPVSMHQEMLRMWEDLVRCSLLTCLDEDKKRMILSFKDSNFEKYNIRECDFIAVANDGSRVIIEIKLKEKMVSLKRNSSSLGMNQLRSLEKEYRKQANRGDARSMLLCIDLGFIYKYKKNTDPRFPGKRVVFDDIHMYVNNITESRIIWIDSEDLVTRCVKHGLMTEWDIEYMRKLKIDSDNYEK